MKKALLIIVALLLICGKGAYAQFVNDVQGHPITEISYTDIEGDPYLLNKWTSGTIVLSNNKSFSATLKLDTYGNRLLYRGENGETMEFENKLTSFTLPLTGNEVSDIKPIVFVNNIPPVDNQTENSWYQLIADGKVKLLKYYGKQLMETKAFNSATTTKSFTDYQVYYIFRDNQLIKVSLNKKSLVKALAGHIADAESYLKTNNLNLKSDAGLQKFFVWYNSLN